MPRILIVEDEPVNQEFLVLALSPYGECHAVCTGEEAVEAFKKSLDDAEPYDVVLLDLMLPGMGGLQALEKLRELEDRCGLPEERRARAIVTTALDDDQLASRAFIQGHAVAYLTKPFRLHRLRDEMAKLGLLEE